MNIGEILANAMDLSGGSLIEQRIGADFPLLNLLNVIDTMMLELAQCGKQIRGFKHDVTFSAGTNTGTINSNEFSLDEKYIRYRPTPNERWQSLEIVNDIEDLTLRENRGARAICFQGATSPYTYFLSWTPGAPIAAEIWAKKISPELAADLTALPPFPPEFSLLAAYRTAEFVLNQLLLIDGKSFMPFVQAQKTSLRNEQRRCEHIWSLYRTAPADSNAHKRVREYEAEDDFFNDDNSGYDFHRLAPDN